MSKCIQIKKIFSSLFIENSFVYFGFLLHKTVENDKYDSGSLKI